MVQKINKNLFEIVESIAEKEIERDPVEFIRKESFVNLHSGQDEFFSFKEKVNGIGTVHEEDDEYFEDD